MPNMIFRGLGVYVVAIQVRGSCRGPLLQRRVGIALWQVGFSPVSSGPDQGRDPLGVCH